jgi:light-regulated signal transduction histidine kinase (bacteriophytochrome)
MIVFYNNKQSNKFKSVSKNFSIPRCVNECMAFIAADAEINKISCNKVISPDLPPNIHGDPIRYKQILNNILCNSVKSCPMGDGFISVKVELLDNRIYTTVADNGTLMSKDEIEMLLNPLAQPEKANLQIRFGIGMILCRDMCKRCDGDLDIYCKDGQTYYTFWVQYKPPILEGSQQCICVEKSAMLDLKKIYLTTSQDTDFNSKLKPVLVVDDTPFNNIMIKHMLNF